MLEERKDIDAVIVSTPDHHHAPASVMAMRLGKHVYCQKPLTHSIYESRRMREVAREMNVVTQMGNQGHAFEGARRIVELIRDGAIGEVREVHCWTDRPNGKYWHQPVERPQVSGTPFPPDSIGICGWGRPPSGHTGTAASTVRTIGGPGGILDPAPSATWRATSSIRPIGRSNWDRRSLPRHRRGDDDRVGSGLADHHYNSPSATPKPTRAGNCRGSCPPSRSPGTTAARSRRRSWATAKSSPRAGTILVGREGADLTRRASTACGTRSCPQEKFLDYKGPDPYLPRNPRSAIRPLHRMDRRVQRGADVLSNFDYASRLTEAMLVGVLAVRLGKKIEWDGENQIAKNAPEAAPMIKREYRPGWTV